MILPNGNCQTINVIRPNPNKNNNCFDDSLLILNKK